MKQNLRDRREAGRQLAARLKNYRNRSDCLVLALPRGGVPVGAQISKALGVPLDLLIVRKLGVPGHEELAFGAVSSGGILVVNYDIVEKLELSKEAMEQVLEAELDEVERRQRSYLGSRKPEAVQGKVVILVDDGIATGATVKAGIKSLREAKAGKIILAVPVVSPDIAEEIRPLVDEMQILFTPAQFSSVGKWYEDFSEVTDEEVRLCLESDSTRIH